MKRILLVLGLVLVSTLLFADFDGGPNGETAGNLHMYQKGALVRARLAVQTQLMSQLGPQEGEPAAGEPAPGKPAEGAAQAQKRTGYTDGAPKQDQERNQDQAQDRQRDGVCDGSGDGPDWDEDKPGRGE
ncbi:MAG: hypothetical protein JW820_18150 [Spirochaetales bacterium]|nr:hypothetical protein [Spirochaetales bacterium]